jgi:hypothetical protein
MCAFDEWRGAKTDTAQHGPAALMAGRSGQLAYGRGSGLVSIIRLLETKNDRGSPCIWSPASAGGLQQDWCTSARRRWIITWVAVRRDGQQKCRGGPPVALPPLRSALPHLLPNEPCRSRDHQHNAAPAVTTRRSLGSVAGDLVCRRAGRSNSCRRWPTERMPRSLRSSAVKLRTLTASLMALGKGEAARTGESRAGRGCGWHRQADDPQGADRRDRLEACRRSSCSAARRDRGTRRACRSDGRDHEAASAGREDRVACGPGTATELGRPAEPPFPASPAWPGPFGESTSLSLARWAMTAPPQRHNRFCTSGAGGVQTQYALHGNAGCQVIRPPIGALARPQTGDACSRHRGW